MRRSITAAVFVFGLWLFGNGARAETFKDGETVCFLGDSITAGGRCQNMSAEDLNQEILSLRGLAAGDYELRIDGVVMGRHSAQDLQGGINLAFNDATPQFKQAQTVARFNAQRRDAESQACSLMNTRRWMQSHYKINPDDPAAVQAHYDSFKNKSEYSAAMALNYIKKWSQYGDLRQQVSANEQAALASRQPVPHIYAIMPTKK